MMIHDSLPRLAATRFLSALTPRAYVGRTSPLRLREIPDPALPAPDWAVARARLSGLRGSDYEQIFMNSTGSGFSRRIARCVSIASSRG